nr:short-chain dehydrogenase/reductase tropg [Quercus suber]
MLTKEQSDTKIKESAAMPSTSEQRDVDQRFTTLRVKSGQTYTDDRSSYDPHDSDDEPMVYRTPRDYATLARGQRDRLIAEGADPDPIILLSEIRNHVPAREGEPSADFAKRYVETMKAMMSLGVSVLNDQFTADVVASGFATPDGRHFDLGPGSGATKGEFREFREWFMKIEQSDQAYENVAISNPSTYCSTCCLQNSSNAAWMLANSVALPCGPASRRGSNDAAYVDVIVEPIDLNPVVPLAAIWQDCVIPDPVLCSKSVMNRHLRVLVFTGFVNVPDCSATLDSVGTDQRHRARLRISHLILACRNPEKGNAAAKSIRGQLSNGDTKVSVWQVDLDEFASVKAFCARIHSDLEHLDGLICNAGIELNEYASSEGLERTLTINVVSTFYIAAEVLPKLRETARLRRADTHLEIVGSCIHVFGPDNQLQVDGNRSILDALSDEKVADMAQRYNLSKLMVHQCFNEFVKTSLVKDDGSKNPVIMTLVNPGWCSTELARGRGQSTPERIMFVVFGRTGEQGSRTLVHGIMADRKSHGCYLSECKIKQQSSYVRSPKGLALQQRLWNEMTKKIERIKG